MDTSPVAVPEEAVIAAARNRHPLLANYSPAATEAALMDARSEVSAGVASLPSEWKSGMEAALDHVLPSPSNKDAVRSALPSKGEERDALATALEERDAAERAVTIAGERCERAEQDLAAHRSRLLSDEAITAALAYVETKPDAERLLARLAAISNEGEERDEVTVRLELSEAEATIAWLQRQLDDLSKAEAPVHGPRLLAHLNKLRAALPTTPKEER